MTDPPPRTRMDGSPNTAELVAECRKVARTRTFSNATWPCDALLEMIADRLEELEGENLRSQGVG